MITEDYVSFEVAKMLREKGFNIPVWTRYEDANEVIFGDKYNWNNSPMGHTSAPTHQMAMKWLIEEYGISIEISALKRYRWVYTIYKLFEEKITEVWNDGTYVSYEDAVEAALKYFLEKQCEKTNPYSGISFEYNGHIWGMCARDNGVDILLDKQLFKHLEKQDEQKEINLVEILKHYPKETELYSPLYGKLWLAEVDEKNEIITCYKHHLEEGCTRAVLEQEDTISFYSNGTTGLPDFNVSKDCMLFLYDIEKQGEQKASYATIVETGDGGINALVTRELPTDGCDNERNN